MRNILLAFGIMIFALSGCQLDEHLPSAQAPIETQNTASDQELRQAISGSTLITKGEGEALSGRTVRYQTTFSENNTWRLQRECLEGGRFIPCGMTTGDTGQEAGTWSVERGALCQTWSSGLQFCKSVFLTDAGISLRGRMRGAAFEENYLRVGDDRFQQS